MELLKKLCNTNGCSGNEKNIAQLIIEDVKSYADSINVDALGNVIVHKNGRGKKLMLTANMDEAGFFTTISNDKEIKISLVGNIDTKSISNCVVQFENGDKGVLTADKTDKICDFNVEMLNGNSDYTGMTAVFDSNFAVYGDNIVSKALSSRIGCYVLIQLIKSLNSEFDLYFVFTVKKHIGMKGAKVAGFDIKPDYAVVIDSIKGESPSVIAKDKLYIADNCLKDKLMKCGFKSFVDKDLTTQAGAVQVCGNGVKTAAVGMCVKHINSQNETCKISDINAVISNLKKFAEKEF